MELHVPFFQAFYQLDMLIWQPPMLDFLAKAFISHFVTLFSTTLFFHSLKHNTPEAEYAHRVYSNGVLLVNWVAIFSAYPIIHSDENEMAGKGNYQNYDAHFIPVFSPQHPCSIYHACTAAQQHQYTEVVVFDSAQVFPRFIVELQKTFGSPHSIIASSPASPLLSSSNVNDLLTAMMKYQLTLDEGSPLNTLIDKKIGIFIINFNN